jgi:hypothetical protein
VITYIVPCPCVGINNSIKDKMTDTLQDESGGGFEFGLIENSHRGTLRFRDGVSTINRL